MKANELRIGNLVIKTEADEECEIFAQGIVKLAIENSLHPDQIPIYKPIPLTPEWLERFGFKGFKVYDSVFGWSMSGIDDSEGFIIHELDGEFTCKPNRTIDTVHLLQNIYHALTGEELKLK
jgi:hypothetical protein